MAIKIEYQKPIDDEEVVQLLIKVAPKVSRIRLLKLKTKLYLNYLKHKFNMENENAQSPSEKKGLSKNLKIALYAVGVVFFLGAVGGGLYLGGYFGSEGGEVAETEGGDELTAQSEGAIYYTEGEVELFEDGGWVAVDIGDKIVSGDSVKTKSGARAVVELGESYVRLSESSEVKIAEYSKDGVNVEVLKGDVYHRVKDGTAYTAVVNGDLTAEALGTAFETKVQNKEVYVWESQVKVEFQQQEKVVQAGNRVRVQNNNQLGEAKIDKQSVSEFQEWNKQKDQEKGYQLGYLEDTEGPELTVTSPSDGSVETTEVAVAGSVEAGASVYVKVNDGDWDEVTVENGDFTASVSLVIGENKIQVKAMDAEGNKSIVTKTVSVTEEMEDDEEEEKGESEYLTLTGSAKSDGVHLSWSVKGYDTSHGFKVLEDFNGETPVYPGSGYKYLTDPSARSYTWPSADGSTYNYRVCTYDGNGNCVQYSNVLNIQTVNAEKGGGDESGSNYATSVSLSAQELGSGKVKLTWDISGGSAPNGFKIAWQKDPNPGYPSPNEGWKYVSDKTARSYTVTGLEAGAMLNFRVCVYKGDGTCGTYSNNADVVVDAGSGGEL